MAYSALIPFAVLLFSFAGLKLPLTYASFIGLLSGTLLTQTLFHATESIWAVAISRTLEMMIEIGVILIGAFFFLETGKKTGVIESLANLVRSMTPNRGIQATLVAFPLALMVEGSSGFGTPLLVIAPILLELKFDARLCALLPFVSMVIGIPFGALGTPTRLGFPGANPSAEVFLALAPFVFISPLLILYLVSKRITFRESLWALSMSTLYFFTGREISATGPELAALGPAFFTFCFGLVSSGFLFSKHQKKKFELKGLFVYGLLLLSLWGGKEIFMDQLIPGTHIRVFNPGYIFILFSLGLLIFYKTPNPGAVIQGTVERSKRTLMVFFCMTFIVQQLRASGSIELFTRSLPPFFSDSGVPILGWFGSLFVGTSTMSNLLFSKGIDPIHFVALASGSALGVPLAFQSIVAMKSILNEKLNEKSLYLLIAPLSLSYLLILYFELHF